MPTNPYHDEPEEDESDLDLIRNWPANDFKGLMQYVKEIWAYADWGWSETGQAAGFYNLYSISTAGWSGNELLIEALKSNHMFWLTCWQESRRGGHYKFKVA